MPAGNSDGVEKRTMANEPKDETLSLQIANQIVNVANARLDDGVHPEEIATGLRHAAANFSAFVEQQRLEPDAGRLVEEFARLLEGYLGRRLSSGRPAAGLEQLIEQAKNEI